MRCAMAGWKGMWYDKGEGEGEIELMVKLIRVACHTQSIETMALS